MEHYSVIKRNRIVPSAEMWVDLEMLNGHIEMVI